MGAVIPKELATVLGASEVGCYHPFFAFFGIGETQNIQRWRAEDGQHFSRAIYMASQYNATAYAISEHSARAGASALIRMCDWECVHMRHNYSFL